MASTTGPRFAYEVEAPAAWNRPGLHAENQLAVRLLNGHEGWMIQVTSKSFRDRLLSGFPQWIFVSEVLREDSCELHAFQSLEERALFEELREIDAVGPSTAAKILSATGLSFFAELAAGKSIAGLKVAGVGPKTLEKLAAAVKENKERYLALFGPDLVTSTSVRPGVGLGTNVLQALAGLGISREDAEALSAQLLPEIPDLLARSPGEILRELLKRWGQNRNHVAVKVVEVETR